MNLETAYRACEKLAKTHYENFPVASILLPRKIRRPVAVIYAFAREADDLADEGDLMPEQRLRLLQDYWDELKAIITPNTPPPIRPVFIALKDVFENFPTLPTQLFFDLLIAFKQDVTKQNYQNFDEVLEYCHYSANPVGRLMLHLTQLTTEANLEDSDAICTALQLINFLQDLKSDLNDRNRCYIPMDEMQQFGITLEILKNNQNLKAINELMAFQASRIQKIFNKGANLGNRLPGLFGFEIRLIIQGGQFILNALEKRNHIYERPTLKFWYWLRMFYQAFWRSKLRPVNLL